jgi:superfamily II DNA helicase RecQ
VFYSVYRVIDYKQLASGKSIEEQNRIYEMAKYCENEFDCRQALLLHTLGENLEQSCGNCDVCANAGLIVKKDLTKEAQSLVRLVQSFTQTDGITSSYCRQLFKNHRVGTSLGGKQTELFGAGSHLSKEEIDRLYDKLCFLGVLDEIPRERNTAAMCIQVCFF